MIIADLFHADDAATLGRAYLSDTPFPGDTIATRDGVFLVVRRRFIDLGPVDPAQAAERLSAELIVRPA